MLGDIEDRGSMGDHFFLFVLSLILFIREPGPVLGKTQDILKALDHKLFIARKNDQPIIFWAHLPRITLCLYEHTDIRPITPLWYQNQHHTQTATADT